MNLPTKIDSFDGPWRFLSNFSECEVTLDGVKYRSVELAYQAAKTLDLKQREKFTYEGVTSGRAKQMGQALKLRSDWQEVKVGIMRDLLMQKFKPSILRRRLLSTFQAELIEGNHWHDVFFGICYGGLSDGFNGRKCREWPHEPYGENWLGKLLMEVRRYYGFGEGAHGN